MWPVAALAPALSLLQLLACNDQNLGRFNSTPEAVITSHVEGDDALEGYTINVRGSASDSNDSDEDLVATWYLGDDIVCEGAAPVDGLTTCEMAPTPTASKITLEVRDPENATGSSTVQLEIVPTEAPTAQILFPSQSERYYSDEKVTYQATVSDNEDDEADLAVVWQSDLDGELDLQGVPDSSGLVTTSGYLSQGEHAITLTVTDQSGKTGADQVVIDVGAPNTAPACEITSPEDNGAAVSGTSITLAGTVSDADQPSDSLVVTWSSNLDGTISTSQTPTSEGAVSMAWPGLSTGVHTLSMSVQDELGLTCTDAVTWTTGNVPSVEITLPSSGSTVNEGATVTFQGTVSDDEDAASDLSISWSSNVDGELSTAAADSSGQSTFTYDSLSAGVHIITLTATDSAGLPGNDTASLIVNQAPGAPTVSISPDDPQTGDDLGVIIDSAATDPDGDAVTYTYAWYKNDVEATSWTTTSVDNSATSKGNTWRVEVRATDGAATGDAATAEVTINNTAPAISSVSLTPTSVYTNDTLSANVSSSDADGDSVSYTYAWTVAGSTVGASSSTLSGATYFDKGQLVSVTVTPSDGDDSGTAVSSSSVTVLNSPPSGVSATIDPTDPLEGLDDLICELTSGATDADGDDITYTFAWDVDGSDYESASTTSRDGDTVDGADTIADEVWTCTITPDDGEENGASSSDSVTILADTIDYTDYWDLGTDIYKSCAFGLVTIDFSEWTVNHDPDSGDISLNSRGSGQPGEMDGTMLTDTTFEVNRSIPGTCTETYTVTGEFTDSNTMSGSFTVAFSGGSWCFDCTGAIYDFTATR